MPRACARCTRRRTQGEASQSGVCLTENIRRQVSVSAAVANGAGAAEGAATASAWCPCLEQGSKCTGTAAECTTGDNPYW